MNITVTGNLEAVDQLINFIDDLNDTQYTFRAQPWFDSSIGQHLRHIVDLYLALIVNTDGTTIDYDVRRRGAAIETNRKIGLQELRDINSWLNIVSCENIDKPIKIITEVSMNTQSTQQYDSSFGRELSFASSHLTHHLALMAVIAKIAGKQVDPILGLAPSTATFIRKQQVAVCAP
ncbi:MAG: DinB family protein [Pseudomonadales bacterium]|nr:DinB family protein [Pseudomonadales bacterium]